MNFLRSARIWLLEAMAVLILPMAAHAAPVFTNEVIQADTGDSGYIMSLKQTAALARIAGDWRHTTFSITNSTATDIVAGDVMAQEFEITNAVPISGGHGVAFWINYRSVNTNGISVDLMLFKAPITCPANSEPFNYTLADGTNYVGRIQLTTGDFSPFASTNSMAGKGINTPVWSTNTSLWCIPVCRQAVTNAGTGIDSATLIFMP